MPRKDQARLSAAARKLFSPDLVGVKNELAEIGQAASEELSRDARECLTLRKHICEAAVKIIEKEVQIGQFAELKKELQATRAAIRAQQGSGATSFTEDQIAGLHRAGTEPSTH